MKWKRFLAGLVVCVLAALSISVPSVAVAAVKEEVEISPMYTYTSRVKSSLSIDDAGVAECYGFIKVYEETSEIELDATLYRGYGDGVAWLAIASWSGTGVGSVFLEVGGERTVSKGMYKLVVRGTITGADGGSEEVSVSSPIATYP